MTDFERRALLGDRQAQEECTQRGIVLPCWRCGGEANVYQTSAFGRPLYAVSCKKHYCGAYGCTRRTEQEAISYWNTRPAPLIGRCGECKHWEDGECNHPANGWDVPRMGEDEFCNRFEPKGGDENAAR